MKKLKLTEIAPYSGKRVQPFDGVKKYLSTGDLQDDGLSFVDVTFESKPSRADVLVSEGDILFAKMLNTNKVLSIDKELDGIIVSTGFSVHRAEDKILYPDYLVQYLKHDDFQRQKNKLCTGAIQSAISNTGIEKIIVPVPENISEQKQVAKMLSKAETLIEQRNQSIALLDKFQRSSFIEMFGDPMRNGKNWEKIKFKDAAKNENSKRIPVKQSERDKREGIYPYYGATGIIDTIDDYKFDGEYLLIAEDGKNLLFRKRDNAFIARGKFWVNNHAHVLSDNGICRLKYLEFFLNGIDLKPFLTGIDQVKLNKENLDRIPVPFPPIKLQDQFTKLIDKSEALKKNYEYSLNELENLYGSLSQQAFKGELKF